MILVYPLFQWNGDWPFQWGNQDARCQNEPPGWYWRAAEEEDEARRRARPQLITPKNIVCATEIFHFFKSGRSLGLKGGRTWNLITDQPLPALRHRCMYIICSNCVMLIKIKESLFNNKLQYFDGILRVYFQKHIYRHLLVHLQTYAPLFLFFISTSTNIPTLFFPASSHYDTLKRRSTPNIEWLNNHSHPRAETSRRNYREPKVMMWKETWVIIVLDLPSKTQGS